MANGVHRLLSAQKIGILGAGHLGLTLCQAFLNSFLPAENLLISYAGNPETGKALDYLGLSPNIVSNETLCLQADIVFIFIRPKNFNEFEKIPSAKGTLFVSGMAGISIRSLKNVFGENICRMMSSGPDTIKKKNAIAAVYPFNGMLIEMLTISGLTPFVLSEEQDMHYFTVGVCLPAALIVAEKLTLDTEEAISAFSAQYPLFQKIYRWALSTVPGFPSEESADEYVHKMSTPGGVTEAIVKNLQENKNFLQALEAGIEKSRSL